MIKDAFADIPHQMVYRYVGGAPHNGILSCGFMHKPNARQSQIDYKIAYYSCFVLLRGSGEYWDETGFRAPLGPGSVVQRLPERCHSTRVDGDSSWLEFYVSFGRAAFDALVELGLLDAARPVGQYEDYAARIPRFRRLLTRMTSAADSELSPAYLEAQQLAILLAGGAGAGEKRSPIIQRACRLLERDLDRQLLLQDVARQLCVGYESLRKQFCREMGMSPDAYRRQKRMQTAQMMLLEGQTATAVAQALGYSDVYAFSKQFKRHFGCAPSYFAG